MKGLKFKYLSFGNIAKEYNSISVFIDGKERAMGDIKEVLDELSSVEDKREIANYEIESVNDYFGTFVVRLDSGTGVIRETYEVAAYPKLLEMISYTRADKMYFPGEEIKRTIIRCLDEGLLVKDTRDKLIRFKEVYIDGEHPLSYTGLYCLYWAGEDRDELRCSRQKTE